MSGVKDAKPASSIKRKKGKSLVLDKDLLSQTTEGISLSFNCLNSAVDYGLGIEDVWTLQNSEAEVLARVLLRRADKGDKAALKVIQAISDNYDLAQAAMIIIPRMGITVKELMQNGAKPKFKLKRRTRGTQAAGGEQDHA